MDLLQYMECDKFPAENQDGNIEYKSSLTLVNSQKYDRLVTQMKWRLSQGYNLYDEKSAWYVIGIFDNGKFADIDMDASENTIKVLDTVSRKCNARIEKILVHKHNGHLVHLLKIVSLDDNDYFPLM